MSDYETIWVVRDLNGIIDGTRDTWAGALALRAEIRALGAPSRITLGKRRARHVCVNGTEQNLQGAQAGQFGFLARLVARTVDPSCALMFDSRATSGASTALDAHDAQEARQAQCVATGSVTCQCA